MGTLNTFRLPTLSGGVTDEYVTLPDAARFYGVSRQAANKWLVDWFQIPGPKTTPKIALAEVVKQYAATRQPDYAATRRQAPADGAESEG